MKHSLDVLETQIERYKGDSSCTNREQVIPSPHVVRSAEAYGTLSVLLISQGHAASSSDLRDIKDPEHPYSLEDLKVLTEDSIEVDDEQSYIRVTFTPTVEHCSMATLIGLCLRVKLMRCLPSRYKVDIRVAPGTHATEASAVTQLGFSHLNLAKPAFVHSYLYCFSDSSRIST
ncbi:MIP18 family protein [Capsicum annuum]|uniref:MIP18 family protein n=1 Tax=Capsicum annuum TaxID=4072 RepID=A0A2G2ZE85_CAPAN|nr:MIP18 family protein [Capsicum annuum]